MREEAGMTKKEYRDTYPEDREQIQKMVAPYPVRIEKVSNGYICKIGCQTYVHEGRAETGLKKLLEYFEKFEK